MKNKKMGSVLSAGLMAGVFAFATLAPLATVYAATPVTVTITKYIDGQVATALSSQGNAFTMNAAWNAANIGAGSGQYSLSNAGYAPENTPFVAKTVAMDDGANYSTDEVVDGTIVGAACTPGSATMPSYTLAGYTTGDTMAAAIAATPTVTAPTFTNMTSNKFVIVWNTKCPVATTTEGTVGGDVIGGLTPGALAVTSVVVVNSTATADGTFAHGWKYTFNITVPDAETHLAMKFANWTNTANSSIIATANNMRISSAQADNSGATVLITAANTYSTPTLNMTSDLDAGTPGKQVQVTVEVAVPTNSINGAYTTSYGVQTLI